jgi:hypothetical protein
MTAAAFDRLLYTDCRPGTGRGAGGGFQVQAQSPGVDSVQSALAVGWLLYEVQNAWIVQRRLAEDFPLGFAHANGDGYGTSQSRYLGKEATGGRQGNHLADCLLTRDPALYGTIRPAQLWRSALWRAVPWDTTDCPPYESGPEPGPLTLDAVAEWLRDRSERGQILTRLLSVLEDPAGERVVIVADTADEAMTWIAAATLLLPERRALDVSFKVFSAGPLRAEQRIVAAPADLNPQLGPGHVSGVFILDAAECTADDAEPSERAAFLVGKLAGDDDPYDVVDAIELADKLGAEAGPADADAVRTGWALTRPDDPLADPEPLFRWLNGAKPEQLREHGKELATMLLHSAPGADVLRWVDAAAMSGDLDLDMASVRAPLLDAELAEVLDGRPAPPEVLRSVPLSEQGRRDAESKLSSAILLSSEGTLNAKQIDLVLRLTRRHGINLELSPPLLRQLHKFAVIWTDRPAAFDPRGWARRDEILDFVYEVLRDRFAEQGPQAMMETLRDIYFYFADRVEDPDDLLYCHLQAAAIARLEGERRQARLSESLDQISQLRRSRPDPSKATTAAIGLQRALLQWGAVDADVAVTIFTALPAADVDPEIPRYATSYLNNAAAKPDLHLLKVLTSLDRLGKAPSSERLDRLLAADRYVRQFIERADGDRIMNSNRYFNETVELLRKADPGVVVIRGDAVLDALLTTRHPDLARGVFATIPNGMSRTGLPKPGVPKIGVARTLIAPVRDRLAGAETLDDLVDMTLWCVRILAHPGLEERRSKLHADLAAILRECGERLRQGGLETWRAEVERCLKPEGRQEWDAIFSHEPPKQGGRKQAINLWRTRS